MRPSPSARSLVGDWRFRRTTGSLALASAMLFVHISLSSLVLQHRDGLSPSGFAPVFAAHSIGIILTGWATVHLLCHTEPTRLMDAALLAQ